MKTTEAQRKRKPTVTYSFRRLGFKAEFIEPLKAHDIVQVQQ